MLPLPRSRLSDRVHLNPTGRDGARGAVLAPFECLSSNWRRENLAHETLDLQLMPMPRKA
jgi:hypothetical protein